MNLIVVSDIFGRSEALDEFVALFSERYDKIEVVDPYGGQPLLFSDEAHAYRYFQQHCGLDNLTARLCQALDRQQTPIDLIGFSVGATAVWRQAESPSAKTIRQAFCFYGSRIREHADIDPLCPTCLIFPEREDHFDIEPLIARLSSKPNVKTVRTNALHGFMNRLSRNFSSHAYRYYCRWLLEDRASSL